MGIAAMNPYWDWFIFLNKRPWELNLLWASQYSGKLAKNLVWLLEFRHLLYSWVGAWWTVLRSLVSLGTCQKERLLNIPILLGCSVPCCWYAWGNGVHVTPIPLLLVGALHRWQELFSEPTGKSQCPLEPPVAPKISNLLPQCHMLNFPRNKKKLETLCCLSSDTHISPFH